jgi:long-chain acyl-CoA synthetase
MSREEVDRRLRSMEEHFRPGALDREITYYLSLGDTAEAKWTLRIGPEAATLERGRSADRADCVLKTTARFFLRMVEKGYKPGMRDFMMGRIRSNDPWLLKELEKAFGF